MVVLCAQACSSIDDDIETETEETSQAVTADWIHPACQASALMPPGNDPQRCDGPWTYSHQDWWNNRAACGDSNVCAQYNSCTSWDLVTQGDGLGYTVATFDESIPNLAHECTWFGCWGLPPEDGCAAQAVARENALVAARPGMSWQARSGFHVTGQVSDVQYTEFGCGPFDQGCVQHWDYTCRLHVANFPTPSTGPHPWCGCAVYTAAECPRGGGTFVATDTPKAIPDNNPTGVTSVAVVPAGLAVRKVIANVIITHTWRGNLEISIIAPNGQVAMLSNRQGGSADNFIAIGMDISSNFTVGSPAAGNWQLRVRDLAAADVGAIQGFSLEIIATSPTITTATTAPGSIRPASPGPPATGSSRREFVATPSCMTCDNMPIGTDAEVRAKFDCFANNLATATGEVQASLAARMKLLLHLAGERLTPAQRAQSEGLYDTQPTAAPSCSVPITWAPSCLPDADSIHLTTRFQLCQDLVSNPNTSQGAAAAEATGCFAQLTALGGLTDPCVLAMRDAADATAQSVLKKAQPSFGGDFAVALPVAFARIAAWWSAATGLARGDQVWFAGESSALARWLWSTIEAQRMPLPQTNPATDAQAALLLADINSTRLSNDVAVLNYAFAAGQTTSAPPVLTLTSDALKALVDRLGRLQPIHDVGCRFKPCKTATALVSSAASELTRVLASLPDATALTASLAAATHLQQQQPAIHAALTKVRDQHVYLRTAWDLLGTQQPFTNLAAIDNPPLEATGLAALVRDATVAWSSYQATGVFTPWNRARLTAATLRQVDLVAFVNGLVATVTGERTSYTASRLSSVQDLLDQSRTGAAIESQNDQLAELADRALDIASRIDGIEQRESTERTALTTFQTQFEAIVNSGALDPNAAYQSQTLLPLNPSAGNRRYPNNGARNVIRDEFAKVPLKAGQSLRIRVTGQWAPACAVAHASIIDPNLETESPIVIDQSLTGPEGYYLVASGNTYHSRSRTASLSGTVSASTSACVNTSSPSGTGGSISTCSGSNYSYQLPSTSTTTGTEAKVSASFTFGLRLPTTPYPEAPAGSLVAVITRKGVTGGPTDPPDLDIRVVHETDLIVGGMPPALNGWPNDGELEVHFVVNDRAQTPAGSPCPVADPSALQIEMTRVTPFGNIAMQLGAAMGDTLAAIELAAPAVIRQGELSSFEQAALRADGWARLQQALVPSGIGLAGLPVELRQLFDAYLERELASIGRRAQIGALHRQLAQLALQMDAIRNQQLFSTEQDRLLHLVPRWRLRDLAGTRLSRSTSRLSEALTAHAAPIFELRDPSALSNFRTQVAAQTDEIIQLGLAAPYEDAVDDLTSFASAVATAVGNAQFNLPTDQRRTIVLAVPRPAGPGHGAWSGPWRTVSPTTANGFWSSVFDAQGNLSANASVTLSPADLYTGPGGSSHLACVDLAPVVRHVGLYFATDGEPSVLGPLGMEIAGTAAVSSPVLFPLFGRITSFESSDPLGIPIRPRTLNGDTVAVLGDGAGNPNFSVWPADLGAGAGISPFTSFRLDMRAFGPQASQDVRNVLTHTTALFFVFEVERRASNLAAWIPGVCNGP
jgi:subtilisin-like proprotein convertase family protein